ncbi:hypothetical protein Btru_027242 [Bulinus truncatus]|nr:hypothetical protein Btru_027242 [Bulinus truncatus]
MSADISLGTARLLRVGCIQGRGGIAGRDSYISWRGWLHLSEYKSSHESDKMRPGKGEGMGWGVIWGAVLTTAPQMDSHPTTSTDRWTVKHLRPQVGRRYTDCVQRLVDSQPRPQKKNTIQENTIQLKLESTILKRTTLASVIKDNTMRTLRYWDTGEYDMENTIGQSDTGDYGTGETKSSIPPTPSV